MGLQIKLEPEELSGERLNPFFFLFGILVLKIVIVEATKSRKFETEIMSETGCDNSTINSYYDKIIMKYLVLSLQRVTIKCSKAQLSSRKSDLTPVHVEGNARALKF